MATIYFDVTDIVHFASRYNRLTGIQRVQLNIITLLAERYGGTKIRCCFFGDRERRMFEFDPAERTRDPEFDAENFLSDLGLTVASKLFPSKVQVKSHLRAFNNRKLLRTWRKIDIYLSAIFRPSRVRRFGIEIGKQARSERNRVVVSALDTLPRENSYVCLGSVWLCPQIWGFAQAHRERGGDVVQMIYDLIPVLHPAYLAGGEAGTYKTWLDASLRYSSRYISISNWTAKDLLEYAAAKSCAPAVRTIPLAHELKGHERGERLSEVPPEMDAYAGASFVLCVGTIEHRKNTVLLMAAWRELLAELGDKLPLLLFAGKYGSGSAEFQSYLAQHPELAQHVKVVHAPSDRQLVWLYGNALFTVLPSRIEGWGLPVGEAAWFGKFCVASNATSIPEVCGDLVDYFDPTDIADMKRAIGRPIADREYLRQRELRIATAELRTWNFVANEIHEFLCMSGVENAGVRTAAENVSVQ